MTLLAILSLSSLALLSNALSARDFFADDKCQQLKADDNDLLVKTETGCIEGTRVNGTRVFRGIPYASPPVGNLRWRPPQPHKPWNSTLKTMDFRSTCFQTVSRGYGKKTHPPEGMWPSIQGVDKMSEVAPPLDVTSPHQHPSSFCQCTHLIHCFCQDCLFMNVMAPSTGPFHSRCGKDCDFDLKQSYPHSGVCSDDKNVSCSCLDSPNPEICGPPLTKPSKGFPVMAYIHVSQQQPYILTKPL